MRTLVLTGVKLGHPVLGVTDHAQRIEDGSRHGALFTMETAKKTRSPRSFTDSRGSFGLSYSLYPVPTVKTKCTVYRY